MNAAVDFSLAARSANIERMTRETFDTVIIGAGINGCCIANELAFRGLSVALIDKGDFASGTSQTSGLAIWGGIKYLQQLAFGFVACNCHERWVWQQRAPGLVKEYRYLFPHYRGDAHGLVLLGLGVWLHYFLGGNGFRTSRPKVFLSPDAVRTQDPRLRAKDLTGAVAYSDAVMITSDADLTLRVAMTAAQCGAVFANYVVCAGFEKDSNGRLAAAHCREKFTGREFELRGRTFINAGGIWAEQINALAGFDDAPHGLALRRGTFLSVPARSRRCEEAETSAHTTPPPPHVGGYDSHYLTLLASDGRPMFGIPWGPVYLIGTTDIEHPANHLDDVRTSPDEVSFILREFNARLDWGLGRPLTPDDVIESRVGVRPLAMSKTARDRARGQEALALSRDHKIDHSPRLGLYTVLGGKFTPARQLAE
ncbi:MAG: FAD-dependent oxidoreductase, partial [Verrucomicrobia bacterium]|nr:FAD-dependent oxidoreductase [Verrucomicrobiota bacterium]